MTELDKLEELLKAEGISYDRIDIEDGVNHFHQISVKNDDYSWDVICHKGSYGYEQGLLEFSDTIEPDVIGNLTAEHVLKLVHSAEYRRGYNDAMWIQRCCARSVTSIINDQ